MQHDAPRLTTHSCKGCGAVLALIDPRARKERFALWCPECSKHLVLRPDQPERVETFERPRDVSVVV